MKRRAALATLGAAALALPLGGCSSLWPWSGRRRLPELPPITGDRAQLAWSVALRGGGSGFQPALAAGSVYAVSRDGAVVRVDAASGSVIWRATLDRGATSGAGSDGTLTVVADRDGVLQALDADGRRKWSAPTGAAVTSVPAVGQGLVIARGSDNRVQAFDAQSGRRRWAFSRQSPSLVLHQTAAVVIDGQAAYVGLPGGRLLALALENGAVRWEAAVATPRGSNEIERIADVLGAPRLTGGEVCAATFLGRVACFDAASGRALWSREIEAVGGLDSDERTVVVADERGHVHALARSGAALWREESLSRRSLSAPLLLGDVVVVGDAQGLVHLLARADGKPVGRLATDGSALVAQPVRAGALAILQTSAGALYAIGARRP